MHNVTFSFNILSAIEGIRLRWKPINNGVSKCFIRYPDHTLELTKSPNENESVLEVHLSEVYIFDPYQGLLKQYDMATIALLLSTSAIQSKYALFQNMLYALGSPLAGVIILFAFVSSILDATKKNAVNWKDRQYIIK
jgi:hypothetical protein